MRSQLFTPFLKSVKKIIIKLAVVMTALFAQHLLR